jgi:hypothetical protein
MHSVPSGCSAEYLGPNIQSVTHCANVPSIYRLEHHSLHITHILEGELSQINWEVYEGCMGGYECVV